MARRQLQGNGALGTTSLVNEMYIKLFRHGGGDWADRSHFLATAARAMRQVIVDRVRHDTANKRSGPRVPLDGLVEASGTDILALDEVLQRLAEHDSQLVQVVEMRFFAGYTVAETAQILGVSPRTVTRAWEIARAWLARELGDG